MPRKQAGWLKTDAGKGRKQRRTLKQLHADLAALGFTGSYNRVAACAREWRAGRQREKQTVGRGTFVPLRSGTTWPRYATVLSMPCAPSLPGGVGEYVGIEGVWVGMQLWL